MTRESSKIFNSITSKNFSHATKLIESSLYGRISSLLDNKKMEISKAMCEAKCCEIIAKRQRKPIKEDYEGLEEGKKKNSRKGATKADKRV